MALQYRGFMIDSARHFMPVEHLLKIIEAAAKSGMNRFHWHLTDDQGWRVEIKRYPKLTEIGSKRGKSCFWGVDEYENNCGFYSQEDVRRVVEFAGNLGVDVVPEIEVPGHASAMLAAYPEFGCRRTDADGINEAPYKYEVLTYAGVFPNLICAGRDDALEFLKNILDEICELFPAKEVHIGGDEAVKMHWRRCPDCQKRMAQHGLKDENELQRWLVLQVGEHLKMRGKQTIVWNESLSGGMLPDNFIVQHWLGNDEETRAFLQQGGKVIVSDADDYYISRQYHMTTAHKVWRAHTPKYAEGYEDRLYGLECPLWTERITNHERAEYMLFPRLFIAAMKAKGEKSTWPKCVKRIEALIDELAPLNLNIAPREDWNPLNGQIYRARKLENQKRQAPEMQEVFRICDFILKQEALEKRICKENISPELKREAMDYAWANLNEFAFIPEAEIEKGYSLDAEYLAKGILSELNL